MYEQVKLLMQDLNKGTYGALVIRTLVELVSDSTDGLFQDRSVPATSGAKKQLENGAEPESWVRVN
jgi:hypothetical protein